MSAPFFITSLPRSRTAWLSAWLTTERTLCFHEPGKPAAQLIQENPGQTVGIADSTLALKFNQLLEEFPDAPWLYIERDPFACRASLLNFTRPHVALPEHGVNRMLASLMDAGQSVKQHPRTLTVDFNDVNARMPEIWQHLLPGEPYGAMRGKILSRLDVQQQFAARLAERSNLPWQ